MRKALSLVLLSLVVGLVACGDSDTDDGGGAGGSGSGGTGSGGSGAGGTGSGGSGGSGTSDVFTVDGVGQTGAYGCTTTLPGGVFGVTTSGGDWVLELSLDKSTTSTWTLPQTTDPVVQVRATRASDSAVYDSNATGSLTVDMDVSTGAPKLRWTVAATLGHTSGGAADPATVAVAGDFLCSM